MSLADSSSLPQPSTAPALTVMAEATAAVARGERVVLATVLRRRGSAPATPGQKLALLGPERALGTIGGGALELRVLQAMVEASKGPFTPPRIERYELAVQMGMCCGGGVEVMIEVFDPALQVLIVGAGHISSALAPMLDGLGFAITVCDAREELSEAMAERLPSAQVLCADHDDPEVRQALHRDLQPAAMLVMTHDHQLDQQVVEWALRQGFGFVGGVGSRAKAARTRARLSAKGFSEHDMDRVRMPCGVPIEARLPAEIAVSIAAEMIQWRARHLGRVKRKDSAKAARTPDGVTPAEQPATPEPSPAAEAART